MKTILTLFLSLSLLSSCKPEPQPRPLSTAEKTAVKITVAGGMYLAGKFLKEEKQDTVKYPSGPSFRYEE